MVIFRIKNKQTNKNKNNTHMWQFAQPVEEELWFISGS